MKKRIIIIVVIVVIGAVVFFFPKESGSGGSCAGCEITSCQCFGFEDDKLAIGPVDVTCYGIPYACETEKATSDSTNVNTNTATTNANTTIEVANSNITNESASTNTTLNVNTTTNSTTVPEVFDTTISSLFTKTPVIIYWEEIGTDDSVGGRRWPIKKIWKKVGDAAPVELASVGQANEYPHYFFISPDYSSLYVSLESKVQKLDLENGNLIDIYTADKDVNSMVFSPDGTQAILWDQKYANQDKNYVVQLLDIDTLQITKLASGSAASAFFARAWRSDDILVMSQPHGEFSTLWNFNLDTGELIEIGDSIHIFHTSSTGTFSTDPNGSVFDTCNDFSGSAWNNYELRDPVSGDVLMEIGDSEKAVNLISFTQDEKRLLYSSHTTWENKDDCDAEPEKEYFLYHTDDQSVTALSNYPSGLDQLDIRHVGAEVKRSGSYVDGELKYSIILKGQTIVTSDQELRIASQFFTE